MVRTPLDPCDLGFPSALIATIEIHNSRHQRRSANSDNRCPMVWRPLLPRNGRNLGIATKEWCATLAGNAIRSRGIDSGLGKQVVFVTNNSTKSRADYRKKLEGLGIPSNVVSLPRSRSQRKPGPAE